MQELAEEYAATVSVQTVRNRLKEKGFNGWVSRKKTFISAVKRRKRMKKMKSFHRKIPPEARSFFQ